MSSPKNTVAGALHRLRMGKAAAAPEARAAAPGDAASAMRCADTPISTDAASIAADLTVSTRAASSFAHGDEVLTPVVRPSPSRVVRIRV